MEKEPKPKTISEQIQELSDILPSSLFGSLNMLIDFNRRQPIDSDQVRMWVMTLGGFSTKLRSLLGLNHTEGQQSLDSSSLKSLQAVIKLVIKDVSILENVLNIAQEELACNPNNILSYRIEIKDEATGKTKGKDIGLSLMDATKLYKKELENSLSVIVKSIQ